MAQPIVCPVCGVNKATKCFEKEGCTFVQCLNDQLVYINPQPERETLQSVYDQYGEQIFLLPGKRAATADYPAYRKQFLTFRQTNRLLEMGTATGGFLVRCRNDGWNTYGVELSVPSSTFAREHHGLDVFTGTVHDARYPSEFFDVVVAWQTLEHVPNPREVVTEVFRVLRPDGLFVMSVPCWKGLSIRLLKKRYRYVGRDHLFYFSPNNLQEMLADVGFVRINCRTGGFNPVVCYQDVRGVPKAKNGRGDMETQECEARVTQWKKRSLVRIIHGIYYRIVERLDLGDTLFAEARKAKCQGPS